MRDVGFATLVCLRSHHGEPLMNAETSTREETDPMQDRRVDLRLRAIFEVAFPLVEPFFDPKNTWGGQSLEHFAFRVLRENYPDLSSEQIFVFVSAARRVYASRQAAQKDKG
jgi:hypothetical protein